MWRHDKNKNIKDASIYIKVMKKWKMWSNNLKQAETLLKHGIYLTSHLVYSCLK